MSIHILYGMTVWLTVAAETLAHDGPLGLVFAGGPLIVFAAAVTLAGLDAMISRFRRA